MFYKPFQQVNTIINVKTDKKNIKVFQFKLKYSELRGFADICFSLPLGAAHTVPSEKYNNLCGFNHHQCVWLRDMNSVPSDFLPSPKSSCHKFQVPSFPSPCVVTCNMSPGRWQTPSPPLSSSTGEPSTATRKYPTGIKACDSTWRTISSEE